MTCFSGDTMTELEQAKQIYVDAMMETLPKPSKKVAQLVTDFKAIKEGLGLTEDDSFWPAMDLLRLSQGRN